MLGKFQCSTIALRIKEYYGVNVSYSRTIVEKHVTMRRECQYPKSRAAQKLTGRVK